MSNNPSPTIEKITEQVHDICAYFMELGMGINNVDNTLVSYKAEKSKEKLIAFLTDKLQEVEREAKEEGRQLGIIQERSRQDTAKIVNKRA